ncbi:MAG: sugar phosphate isomerase/epimerase [Clostridia bacterium]|nr:sugar phosphate isomerase/epimerase [Clostridia bacterium]
MYSIGVSTPHKIDEEMFKKYNEAGITHMEISVGKEECDKLDFQLLSAWAKKYNVCLHSFHLPFWPFDVIDISKESIAKSSVEYLSRFIIEGSKIGIDKYIIHPSGEPIEESDRERRMECAKKSLSILAELADRYNSVICVENLPRTCMGRDSDDILELLSAHPKLVACFDTNHLLGEDPVRFIERVGGKIVTTHISDYDFKNERHWLPGEGEVDWKSILEAFSKIGYSGVWLYEINMDSNYTITRPRSLTYEDVYKNAQELFNGEDLTKISTPVAGLKRWDE